MLRVLRPAHPARSCSAVLKQLRTYSTPADVTCERLSGKHEGIAVLTMARPEARNALGRVFLNQLKDHVEALRFDTSVRVVVLRSGVEKVFCAGADLKERATMNPQEVAAFVHKLRSTFSDVESLPMPTIACINGAALGGGLELAMACDMRVAGPLARMGLPETRLAIIPGAGGTQRLPRIIGMAKAKELAFTAKVLDPSAAEKIGLVNYATESDPYDKALELAEQILPSGPIAIRMAKLAISQGIELEKHAGMIFEQQCYAQVIPTQDRLEGLAAFKEKRTPVYKGC